MSTQAQLRTQSKQAMPEPQGSCGPSGSQSWGRWGTPGPPYPVSQLQLGKLLLFLWGARVSLGWKPSPHSCEFCSFLMQIRALWASLPTPFLRFPCKPVSLQILSSLLAGVSTALRWKEREAESIKPLSHQHSVLNAV